METNHLMRIIDSINRKSPFQKQRLAQYLSGRDEIFFERAETFLKDYFDFLKTYKITIEDSIDAYLKMCRKMIECQLLFHKTGKYPAQVNTAEKLNDIYQNREEMTSYMTGLALSLFLWPTHYEILSFLIDNLKTNRDKIKSYLEIGPGHGLFFKSAMEILHSDVSLVAVDISPHAIEITESMMAFFFPDSAKRMHYHMENILDFNSEGGYDFITMGEVLEHVATPERLLFKLTELLSDTGSAFISTCTDAPAVDHVYHFRTIDEIRKMINDCGLNIQKELILPIENLPIDEIVKRHITINYCAMVHTANIR